ncbi:MAG: hypothetical protein ACYSU0_00070 [Planctomycetota bacterium]|jgi:hypothetical protein
MGQVTCERDAMRQIAGRLLRIGVLCVALGALVGCASAAPYTWPAYEPDLNYHFSRDHPELKAPTKVLDDVTGVAGTVTSGWWCFRYGKSANKLVTEAAWKPMLERMNEESAYFRNVMGWPPDKRAREGYYSTIYLFGSGLSTDKAANTAKGGWMGSVRYKGEHWPMVLISYYPVYSFDPDCDYRDREYQTGGVVHEGVHAILAGLPGCRKAGWFHEGGNNWLQTVAAAKRTGKYGSMGWLSAGAMIAPFMPIECYSGWLQDGSFGGPSAEGVNRHANGKKLCTWRKLLGGTQYGECFPVFMGEIVSPGSVAWIWRNCTGRVLEGLATAPGGLGEEQTRRLITEYRGRQAMCDFGRWAAAYRGLLDKNWGKTIKAEYDPIWINCKPWKATCYVATTRDEATRTLTPEKRTLPGWSGANQIPLKVTGADTVSVEFQPIGENMRCQLVYRATDGAVVYSAPVDGGECSLRLTKSVQNNVVIAVICSTDYVFRGDETRKKKYDYRLRLGKGVARTADIHVKWWKPTRPALD